MKILFKEKMLNFNFDFSGTVYYVVDKTTIGLTQQNERKPLINRRNEQNRIGMDANYFNGILYGSY